MAAITIRNIPDNIHDGLRQMAGARRQSVESLVRETIATLAQPAKGGIDFRQLAHDRKVLGISEDGPEWGEAMDDPALSRKVLGL